MMCVRRLPQANESAFLGCVRNTLFRSAMCARVLLLSSHIRGRKGGGTMNWAPPLDFCEALRKAALAKRLTFKSLPYTTEKARRTCQASSLRACTPPLHL